MFRNRKLRVENLEEKRLLAILWVNEFDTGIDDPRFDEFYGTNETLARAIVNRAIDDWNAVVLDQNYDNNGEADDDNDFRLTVIARPTQAFSGLGVALNGDFTHGTGVEQDGWTPNVPTSATIWLGENGSGLGWYFDPTPLDDAEFTGIVSPFESNFTDASVSGQNQKSDFYLTIAHEIGHALGIKASPGPEANVAEYPGAISDHLTYLDDKFGSPENDPIANNGLDVFRLYDNTTTGFKATLTSTGGGHIYEGSPNDPAGLSVHPNELLNDGRSRNPLVNPNNEPDAQIRQYISDLAVGLLEDAYGYIVKMPSELNTAHATLDSETGTLLVQGLPDAVNEDIIVDEVEDDGTKIEVRVGNTKEQFPTEDVTKIVIAKNGGTYNIDVKSAVTQPWQDAHYVVSSNEDAVDSGTVGDGLIDLDPTYAAGSQITLRAAVQEANHAGNQTIYVPRGNYDLDLTGSGGDTQGDLDITKDVTVVGAGPGATVITAPTGDRHFEVADTGTLTVERLTLTGSTFTGTGAAIHVAARTSSNTALTLKEVAVVNNEIASAGGALFVDVGSKAKVERSVIANDSASFGGGGIAANASAAGFAEVTLVESIVTNNNSDSNDPDLASASVGGNVGKFISAGHNLFGDVGTADLTPAITDPTSTDYESPTGTVNYVVTSVVDTFDLTHTDDDALLSLREAVNLANENRNVTEEIWLPAWSYALTRQSSVPGANDDDLAFGDLEITDGLIVRGAGDGVANVRQDVAEYQDDDDTFDLIGDYDDDFDVDYDDFNLWLNEYNNGTYDEAVDGNDDGVIDADDYYTWIESHTSVLEIVL